MGQGSAVAAATGIRRILHVLRPMALLGGFVLMWWLLATGAAQADGGPRHDGSAKSRSLTGTVERVLHEPADRTSDRRADRVQRPTSAPTKAVRAVRQHAAPTTSATRTIVRSTPVAPIATAASDTVRSGATKAVEQTREVLDTASLGGIVIPEMEGVPDVIESLPIVGDFSTLQGETQTSRPSETTSGLDAAVAGSDSLTSFVSTSGTERVGQQQAAPSSPTEGGFDWPAQRSSGATTTSSVQSPSGSGLGVGLYDAGLDIMLVATKTPISSHADWLPAGPAYAPTSTPD